MKLGPHFFSRLIHESTLHLSCGLLVYIFRCIPRELFTWINGVPVHVDIRWISCEECHPFLFQMVSTCIFHMDYWCTYPRVYLLDIK